MQSKKEEHDYSEDNIVDGVTLYRSNPKKYLEGTDINALVRLLEKIISNLAPVSGHIHTETMGDFSMRVKFDNLIGFVEGNWNKPPFCPTVIFNPNFWPLSPFCQRLEIKEYDSHGPRVVCKYEKGKRIGLHSGNEKFDCVRIEILFTLDKEIWGENLLWDQSSIIEQLKQATLHCENAKLTFEQN